ncbi:MAG TPA: protein kinase [Firmicutes bacterium]|nr:protein kinase [Bacillota bacterium]
MMGEIKRCISCMAEIGDASVCPKCGCKEGTWNPEGYLQPETVLNNRYVLGRLLHANGEGATYIAFDKAIEAAVEIREYFPTALVLREESGPFVRVLPGKEPQYKAYMSDFSELSRQLFKMRTLGHIVQAYEIFEQNNTVYTVYEHIDGITLQDFLYENAGELSWKDSASQFLALIRTMENVHRLDLIHRGLSPETILVSRKGELKISGFCISTVRADNTPLDAELFSGYAAPEQYTNNWHGTWTDVYALAAVFYRALTGTMPPEARSRAVNDNLVMPHQLNQEIPQNVSLALMGAMRLSPQNRTQTMSDFLTEIGRAPVTAETAAPSPQKRFPRWGYIFVAMAITLILLLGISFFLFPLGTEESSEPESSIEQSADIESSQLEESGEESQTETSDTESSLDMSENLGARYAMPQLVGRSFQGVSTNPSYKDWMIFEPEYVYDEEYEQGQIIEQDIPVDTLITMETPVKVKVSKGSRFPIIPDYTGLTGEEFTQKLTELNIVYTVIEKEGPMSQDGMVVSVSPEVGMTVDIATEHLVTVEVIKGSASIPEPTEEVSSQEIESAPESMPEESSVASEDTESMESVEE